MEHKTDIAATRVGTVLEHERLTALIERLDSIDAELRNMEASEPSLRISMTLWRAASEVNTAAEYYAHKLKAHNTLKRQLQDSVALEEE